MRKRTEFALCSVGMLSLVGVCSFMLFGNADDRTWSDFYFLFSGIAVLCLALLNLQRGALVSSAFSFFVVIWMIPHIASRAISLYKIGAFDVLNNWQFIGVVLVLSFIVLIFCYGRLVKR